MEKPKGKIPLWRYLLHPGIWIGGGFLTALGSQGLYVLWSGNDPNAFASSLSSDLLWYRLLPNSTYPLGVLLGIIIASTPLFILMGLSIRRNYAHWHIIRLLGLGGMLAVLFVGGLVVSVKIGGGGDLHNLDAYLALLLVVGSYFCFGKNVGEGNASVPSAEFPGWVTFLVVLAPVFFAVSVGEPVSLKDPEHALQAVEEIKKVVMPAVEAGGEVLFISERQLLTFDYIEGVPLVPEHEKVFLMEMAMSANQAYLDVFWEELRTHRYAVIVDAPERLRYSSAGEDWGEENDAWVRWVTEPLLCYYEPIYKVENTRVWLYLPRENVLDCPAP
jgi:hypothetical protein